MIHRHDNLGTCPGCGTGHPITPTGHCPACAATACSEGDGDRVGLPSVPEVDVGRAIELVRRHFKDPILLLTDPVCCPVCAHVTPACPECGHSLSGMDGEEVDLHVFTEGGTVLVGCEGFHTPLLRAAAVCIRHMTGGTNR